MFVEDLLGQVTGNGSQINVSVTAEKSCDHADPAHDQQCTQGVLTHPETGQSVSQKREIHTQQETEQSVLEKIEIHTQQHTKQLCYRKQKFTLSRKPCSLC